MIPCDRCGRQFSRLDALARHQKSGACVMTQAAKVAAGHSPPPPPPPPHSKSASLAVVAPNAVVEILPGVGEVVRKPDGSFITLDALEMSWPAPAVSPSPGSWKKWAVAGSIGLVIIAGIWLMTSSRRTQAAAMAPGPLPVKMPAAMQSLVPPALFSIVGILLLSKMFRGEIKSWQKLVSDWAK